MNELFLHEGTEELCDEFDELLKDNNNLKNPFKNMICDKEFLINIKIDITSYNYNSEEELLKNINSTLSGYLSTDDCFLNIITKLDKKFIKFITFSNSSEFAMRVYYLFKNLKFGDTYLSLENYNQYFKRWFK